MLFLLTFFSFLGISSLVYANPLACAMCTVVIASSLGISRILGVPDAVIGVWFGAMLLAIAQWTVFFLEKKNIKNKFIDLLCYVLSYSLILPIYMGDKPSIIFNMKKIMGIDEFLFSTIAGSLALFLSIKLYRFMKNKNGGKPHFQFEKVVLPISTLILVSLIFYLTLKA